MTERTSAISRGVAVIGGTAALIAGVTFAAFTTNPVSLTGTTLGVNEVSSTLRIYDFDTNTFALTSTDPDGDGPIALTLTKDVESAKQRFYLQNTGAADLGITAMADGTVTGGLDPTKVKVTFYDDAAVPNSLGTGTLADLQSPAGISLNTTDGKLPANTQGDSGALNTDHDGNYQVTFTLTADASGSQSLNGLNLKFTGTSL